MKGTLVRQCHCCHWSTGQRPAIIDGLSLLWTKEKENIGIVFEFSATDRENNNVCVSQQTQAASINLVNQRLEIPSSLLLISTLDFYFSLTCC